MAVSSVSTVTPSLATPSAIASALSAQQTGVPSRGAFIGLSRPLPDLSQTGLNKVSSRLNLPRVPDALRRPPRNLQDRLQRRLAKATRGGAASLEQRFLQRATFGWNLALQDEIEEVGLSAFLDRQLHPETLDDGGLEEILQEAFPSIAMSPVERLLTYGENQEQIFFEFLYANFYRSLYSPRQLYERMVQLWTDHFNVYLFSDYGIFLKPTEDFEVIRPNALGSFPDLLRGSAHSPAMLDYLTNDSNVAGHPNENYARELMELHSLGVDGGYTEADVKEVARCLTGWTFRRGEQAGLQWGRFAFDARNHDTDAKTVLGEVIPAGGGIDDGERVLDLLASHPSTARFVSYKMLRHLWGYEPDERSLDKMAQVYQDSGGDIPTLVEHAFKWHRMARSAPKVKRPFTLVMSSLRALFAGVDNPAFLFSVLFASGHLPFNWGPPNGYPDSAGYWSGYLVPRFDFASLFLLIEDLGIEVDLPFLDPNEDPAVLVEIFDQLLLGGTMGDTTAQAVENYLRTHPAGRQTLAEAIGLVVASPEFQQF